MIRKVIVCIAETTRGEVTLNLEEDESLYNAIENISPSDVSWQIESSFEIEHVTDGDGNMIVDWQTLETE